MLRSSSICISFLYNYLTSESVPSENEGGDALIKKGHKLKCLADTFASYGGVLAKLSQILCFEHEKNNVFSDCKPYCQEETIEFIKNEYVSNPEFFKDISNLDFNVFKAGSVGQVHKAIYKSETPVVIKVQYLGLFEQFQTDIFILDKLTSYLFYFADYSNAMCSVKTKLYEELDYSIEFKNQQTMYDLWSSSENIQIARLIPELCTGNLLTMTYIDGYGLTHFIDNSTQEERNNIGLYIVEFIFTNFYKHGIFYPDIHYGNFIIKNNNVLYVMDFGCLNDIEDDLLENMINVHKAMIDKDRGTFFELVSKIGIMKEDISQESKEYMYEYFTLQYEPWTSEEFEFTEDWLKKSVYKKTELMKEWILPSNCIYFNKICYGAYHIFTKLRMKGKFLDFFKNLIKYKTDENSPSE